jgi:hypothetical protein
MATDDELRRRLERAARKLDYTDYPDEAAAVRKAVDLLAENRRLRAAAEAAAKDRDKLMSLARDVPGVYLSMLHVHHVGPIPAAWEVDTRVREQYVRLCAGLDAGDDPAGEAAGEGGRIA